ncbi:MULTISPECIES: hypothetical protein [unclassified Beijerinckia]|uniref:hypothetical protein n=1 Tax=unclassified Beijerinckia TaxID=2638183 RepID=UPI0008985A15|nr:MULTISPECIES: hypothetical protein [unclassified Beijerinckia]MDH7794406.1 hypothetical protein [Beijerinckia sp. GAS462]SEB61281.1 hypothetical protein SAMN05443249_0677 [Beijerinckia sp. 28-YEA-48]
MKVFAPAAMSLLLSAVQPASAQWAPEQGDGFSAGYFWALRNHVTEGYRCDSFDDAFRAGCNAYTQNFTSEDDEDDDGDED